MGDYVAANMRKAPVSTVTIQRADPEARWIWLEGLINGSKLPSGQTIEVEVELEEPGDVTVQVCGWIVDRGLGKEDR